MSAISETFCNSALEANIDRNIMLYQEMPPVFDQYLLLVCARRVAIIQMTTVLQKIILFRLSLWQGRDCGVTSNMLTNIFFSFGYLCSDILSNMLFMLSRKSSVVHDQPYFSFWVSLRSGRKRLWVK